MRDAKIGILHQRIGFYPLAACRLQLRCIMAVSASTMSDLRAQLGGLVTLQAMVATESCLSVERYCALPCPAPPQRQHRSRATRSRRTLHARGGWTAEPRHDLMLDGLSAQSLRCAAHRLATSSAIWVRALSEPVSRSACISLLRHEHCLGICEHSPDALPHVAFAFWIASCATAELMSTRGRTSQESHAGTHEEQGVATAGGSQC